MAQFEPFRPWPLFLGIRRKAATLSSLGLVSSLINGGLNRVAELAHPGRGSSTHTLRQNSPGVAVQTTHTLGSPQRLGFIWDPNTSLRILFLQLGCKPLISSNRFDRWKN